MKKNYSIPLDYNSIVQAKIAGVLVIIHGFDSKPSILFTKRSENLKNHASEISFPGGNFVVNDLTPLNTALRETREEIGIDISPEFILGALTPVQTLTSNYIIYPYVAMLEQMPHTQPNEEVQEIFSIPVENLLRVNPENIMLSINVQARQSQPISWENNIICGATARILRFLMNHLE